MDKKMFNLAYYFGNFIDKHPIAGFSALFAMSIIPMVLCFASMVYSMRQGQDFIVMVNIVMIILSAVLVTETFKLASPIIKFELEKKYLDVFEVTFVSKKDGKEVKLTQYGHSEEELSKFWTGDFSKNIEDDFEFKECKLVKKGKERK